MSAETPRQMRKAPGNILKSLGKKFEKFGSSPTLHRKYNSSQSLHDLPSTDRQQNPIDEDSKSLHSIQQRDLGPSKPVRSRLNGKNNR